MKILESIYNSLINLFLTLKSIIKIIVSSRPVKRNKNLLGKNEIVVLGNGPSLRTTIDNHSDFLRNKELFVVNAFVDAEEYTLLKPSNYIIVDPQFWINSPIPKMNEFTKNILNGIITKTTWPLSLYIPLEAKKNKAFIEKLKTNKHIKVILFNKTTIKGFDWFVFGCMKLGIGIPRPENILIPALVLSINMGFKTIYLAGADHSWHENIKIADDNTIIRKEGHFYDAEKSNVSVIRDIFTGKPIHIHQLFESYVIAFKNYHTIETYAVKRGIKIYNISEKSFIDAFKRIKLSNQ